MADASIALPVGLLLNQKLVVTEVLGVGGFGITYAVRDTATGKGYAVKEYYPKDISVRLPGSCEIVPASDMYKELFEHGKDRFLEEAEMLERFNKTPGVVSVYDFFLQHGTCYFVMEMLYGKPLNRIRKENGGRIGWNQLAPVIKKAGEALMAVHLQGVFHRDVGPDNIFLLNDGSVKLIDFGNSKNLTRKEGEKLSVYLKPGFAPPEQYSSTSKQGTFTDVYSLAATIYYMLAGIKLPDPFTIQNSGYRRLKEFGIEPQVSDAVDRALVLKASSRTQTVGEFMGDLGLLRQSSSTTSAQLMPYVIIRLDGREIDRYRLNINTIYTIGRRRDASNIAIDEEHLSRVHCEIFFDSLSGEFYIVDHSSNGTYVGSTRIEREEINRVPVGAWLYLGGPRCQIELGAMYAR